MEPITDWTYVACNGACVAKWRTEWPKHVNHEAERRRCGGASSLIFGRPWEISGTRGRAQRRLVRNGEGGIVYEGGSVEKFEKMDLDLLNYGDFVKLLEDELGYKTEKKLHWYDSVEEDLGVGLYELKGDKEINDLRGNILRNYGL
ncbi:hypothetical protein PIB30_013397 [Stylosanthes scabra]|uniref:PB1-like domain-containing protein n=1 Tax=Stylosanthes scabra TaxID=79078 RepID=A0ABU6W4P3_9FABA|nr:hypothetical protein [Stylosanthes scabra]